ncbi:hypothetical protein C922_05232 [Plasmodium inui San Antonio 1]|uniref:Uncharacterized protein n=1 Tax=Plasmodium inui San Antonio 1 TaxID=1237626 RepID=W6ZTW3_9APIC|nr:hypothetical protein C922_05232 [Plasmodium inui San Antonio 1]EUD64382.1 hypothetical protein C922_05232 [Plasmodium inui San Antonio 1]
MYLIYNVSCNKLPQIKCFNGKIILTDGKFQKSVKQFKFVHIIHTQFDSLNKSDDIKSSFNLSQSVNDDEHDLVDDIKGDITLEDSSFDLKSNNYFEARNKLRKKRIS